MRSLDSSEEVQTTLSDYLRSEIQEFDVIDPKKRAKKYVNFNVAEEDHRDD